MPDAVAEALVVPRAVVRYASPQRSTTDGMSFAGTLGDLATATYQREAAREGFSVPGTLVRGVDSCSRSRATTDIAIGPAFRAAER